MFDRLFIPNIEKLSAKKDIPGLIKALKYRKDAKIRQAAAEVLAKVSDARAVEPLCAALTTDESSEVRLAAVKALYDFGDYRAVCAHAVEALIAALKDQNVKVRYWTTATFAKQGGDERAIEPLMAALKDKEGLVRNGAANALSFIGDERATEALLATLKDEDDDVRMEVALALGDIGDRRAMEALIGALRDRSEGVRWAAANALGGVGDERAIEPLIATLTDVDGRTREWAARSLEKIGDARAVEPLLAALKDSEKDVRTAAKEALRKMGALPPEPELPVKEYLKPGELSCPACRHRFTPARITLVTQAVIDRYGPNPVQCPICKHIWNGDIKPPEPILPTTQMPALRLANPAHPASLQINQICEIVDGWVQVKLAAERSVTSISAPAGELEQVLAILAQGVAACPDDPDLLVAKASVLFASAQFKSAEEVLDEVLSQAPQHFEAKMWKSHWETWSDALRFPCWGEGMAALHPLMAAHLTQEHHVQIVRDGLQKTVAIVFEIQGHALDPRTQVKVEWVLSKTPFGPLLAYYPKILEPSQEPDTLEAFIPLFEPALFSPLEGLFLLQQLAFTPYCYLVFVNGNRVMLNRRIVFGPETARQLGEMAAQFVSNPIYLPQAQFQSAAQWHMNHFNIEQQKFE